MRIDPLTVILTLAALIAFASNSLLTRLALGTAEIDAASFTSIRLLTGGLTLALLSRYRTGGWLWLGSASALRTFGGAIALFMYAAPFTFAYLRIGAATGALVLFGVVQITMIGYGLVQGDRHRPIVWLGLAIALAGLTLLTLPSAARPDLIGLGAMGVAGVSWGAYSLLGRGARDPLLTNARCFLWSSLFAIGLSLAAAHSFHATSRGALLAAISGAVTSGVGYAIWYRVLPALSVTEAATLQLSVPAIAALGAVLFLGESLHARLLISSGLVLGGIGLVVGARR